jgi:hypothetical protein
MYTKRTPGDALASLKKKKKKREERVKIKDDFY